jgi:DNA invertase Pin-like site-specific DNA recombinase
MDQELLEKVTAQYAQDPVTMKIERVACYIRVSTQEQKLHGISLDAQRDTLKRYAEAHGLMIVGWYEDEGVSGRKLIKRRPALQRMLNDAQKGMFDRILFIKLDRYFRSVGEYYECQKILDTNKVTWTATEERYDLTTASGRYWVTQKLAMAEYEADNTGERIKLVNEYKVRTGQPLTGGRSIGVAFAIEKDSEGIKRVVINQSKKPIVMDYINHVLTHQNKKKAYEYVKDKYNIEVSYNTLSRMLKDTKLYGHYRGNYSYCEPHIDKHTWDKLQRITKNNIKETKTRRVYLFTGLLPCPLCRRKMAGTYNNVSTQKRGNKVYRYERTYEYRSYRCVGHNRDRDCAYNRRPNEEKLEAVLLEKFNTLVDAYVKDCKIEDAREASSHAAEVVKSLRAERDRLNRIYRKGDMPDAEYDREYDRLTERIETAESALKPIEARDLSQYEELLQSDWKELYGALTKENKQAFWRTYIKELVLDDLGQLKDVVFF